MTRARPALGEGPGEPVWQPRPGLATSTQHTGQGACALINIHERACSPRTRPSPSRCWGRGSAGRNLEGVGGSGMLRAAKKYQGPTATPVPGSFGPGGKGECGEVLGRDGCLGTPGGPQRGPPPRAPGTGSLCPRVGAPGVGAAALAERSERGSFRLPSRLRQLRLSPREEGLPARREFGPLPASEPPRALCWRQRRRRGWRACRRLLAPRRRPGQTLLGTLKNFPGASLAADSRGSLGRAPLPPKSESAEPGRAPSFLSKPRRGRGAGKLGVEGGGHAGAVFGLWEGPAEMLVGLEALPGPPPRPQCRYCTCRRPPSCSLGGKGPGRDRVPTTASRGTCLLWGGSGNRYCFPP